MRLFNLLTIQYPMSGMYHGNLLSKPVREGIITACGIIRLGFENGKVTKSMLSAGTGLPVSTIRNIVSKFTVHGWLEPDSKGLRPCAIFTEITLYDIVTVFDGWLHVGNANLTSLHGITPEACALVWDCEKLTGEVLKAALSALPVKDFLSTGDFAQRAVRNPKRIKAPDPELPVGSYK